MVSNKRLSSSGFTIVEMLLGIALFGILIPSIVITMNAISLINENSKDLAVANIYAENKIEELRSIGYNSIVVGTTDLTASLPSTLGKNKSGNYTVTNAISGQKVVTISITIENRGRTKTLNYRSVIGELGVGQ